MKQENEQSGLRVAAGPEYGKSGKEEKNTGNDDFVKSSVNDVAELQRASQQTQRIHARVGSRIIRVGAGRNLCVHQRHMFVSKEKEAVTQESQFGQ